MEKRSNYLLLAGVSFISLGIIHFTDIFGNPVVFKIFLLILSISFLFGGISKKAEK